mmetsp:Transcript_70556/g.183915  ORF Transcript_70556/g.183915 Transcript_70556/m.183915 type:complete len:156 (+) Transcript_70556:63-530(+)
MLSRAAAFALATSLVVRAVDVSSRYPAEDPCPFGYGTGCGGGDISPATRAQVAGILEGILKGLTSHKAALLREAAGRARVSQGAAAELRDLLQRLRENKDHAAALDALASMLARAAPDVGCVYFGACGGSDKPLDDATKAQVAALLSGILGRLQR